MNKKLLLITTVTALIIVAGLFLYTSPTALAPAPATAPETDESNGNPLPTDTGAKSLTGRVWVWQDALLPDGSTLAPRQAGAFTLTFADDGSFTATTDCNRFFGSYTAGDDQLTFASIGSTKMYCEASQETIFANLLRDTNHHHFTDQGQLVLNLAFDSGSATFK